MAPFHVLILWLGYVAPLVNCYFWTPVEPNQPFPLPEVTSPEVLPDPEEPSRNAASNAPPILQSGWLSAVSANGPRTVWPISGVVKRHHRVRYCYADEDSKKKASCMLHKALEIWNTALGGGPGKSSGHNLAFSEVTFLGKPQYCFKEYWYHEERGTRNWKVRDDVLSVFWKDEQKTGGVSSATVGYTPKEHDPDYKGFRHGLFIAENSASDVIAHEIGHVLGMMHEMMRADRDDYIEYRCSKVMGYAESLNRAFEIAQKKGTNTDLQHLHEQLCTNITLADKARFSGKNFIKADARYHRSGEPDYESIMMYDSTSFANEECESDISQCPMVKIKKENGIKVGVEMIKRARVPSAQDVAFVKEYYPWKG